MEYNKLVAVSGLPGLFELISSKSDGAIIRSLDDKSTRFVASRVHSFSQLESIEVFTVRENVNLAEIFLAMQKQAATLPDEKNEAAVKKYFEKVYPDMDFERVYNSDLKKMIKWFAVLTKNNIEIKLPEPPAEEPEELPQEQPPVKEPPPAKEKAAPKAAKKKEEAPAAEEKPVKKKAAKKK